MISRDRGLLVLGIVSYLNELPNAFSLNTMARPNVSSHSREDIGYFVDSRH